MRRNAIRLAPVAITALLLVLLWRQLQPGALLDAIASASPRWVVTGTAGFVLVMVVRAVRFGVLLAPGGNGHGPRPPLAALVPLSFAVTLLGNTLPIRGSDVSFVVLSRTHVAVTAAEAAAALAVVRLFDLVAVAFWFVPLTLVALPLLPPTVDVPLAATPTTVWILLAIAAVLGAALLFGLLAVFGRRGADAFEKTVRRLGMASWPLVPRALRFAHRTADAIAAKRRTRTLGGALLLSLLSWGVTFGWLYAFAMALGGPAGFLTFVVGATFAVLSKAIPAPTLGGHGVSETGWALGMTIVGWPASVAISTGLGVSVLNLFAALLFGMPSLLLLERARRRAGALPGAGA